MPLVPVTIKVEEIAFIPVMRALHKLSGVADIKFSFEELGPGRGGARTKQSAAPNGQKMPLKELLVMLLAQGPQHLDVLRKAVLAAGFSKNAIHGGLNELRRLGLTASAGFRMHRLTEKATAELKTVQAVPQEHPALGAPVKRQRAPRGSLANGVIIIVRFMQKTDAAVARHVLRETIVAHGLAARSIDTCLYRARTDGFIKSGGKGTYVLTAKGKHLELPPEHQ